MNVVPSYLELQLVIDSASSKMFQKLQMPPYFGRLLRIWDECRRVRAIFAGDKEACRVSCAAENRKWIDERSAPMYLEKPVDASTLHVRQEIHQPGQGQFP